jgi:gas vesicle protein
MVRGGRSADPVAYFVHPAAAETRQEETMPTSPATRTADDIADNIKSLIDRMVEAQFTQEVARRGHDVAETIAERGEEAWRETRPARRDAIKQISRTTRDAAKWSDRTWRKTVRPFLRNAWKQRVVAASAAGAAVPAAGELVDTAAVRLGLKREEERHWGAFFLGLLVGAAAGAVVALLTTPKRGDEMRHELGTRADELATKARDEWVPIFQGGDSTNGHADAAAEAFADTTGSLEEAAAEGGAAAEEAAGEATEAINESVDAVDRET